MKITNKFNLPSGFYNAASTDDTHTPVDKHYSVTTLLKPDRAILLERRHFDEIEEDVADRLWQVFGTAVHSILEKADTSGNVELAFNHNVFDDYVLTGRLDILDAENGIIEDYKTASVWKIIRADFDDWKRQGLMYAWLVLKSGKGYVNKIRFHALLKDWSPMDKKKAGYTKSYYPERAIYTYEYEISSQDYVEIENYIEQRFNSLIQSEKLTDDELPVCSQAERWNDGEKYAVKKPGAARAMRVFDDKDEAEDFRLSNPGTIIENRPGEDKRCNYYCSCCEFCTHYKKESVK